MNIAERLIEALSNRDRGELATLLQESCVMRTWGPEAQEGHGPAWRLIERLVGELEALPEARIILRRTAQTDRLAVAEYGVHKTDGLSFGLSDRTALLGLRDGLIAEIDVYASAMRPAAAAPGWIAPGGLTDDEIRQVLRADGYAYDIRRHPPVNQESWIGARMSSWGSGDPHPAENSISAAAFTDDEADAEIERIIASYRDRNIGFMWRVSPWDTPADLPERLMRFGMVYAGDQAFMARSGLNATDVSVNPDIEVREIMPDDRAAIEAGLQITAVAFQWTPEVTEANRAGWEFEVTDPKSREVGTSYLAYLDGKPVGEANVGFRGGIAYLGGAGVLPEYRSQRIYSTLLRTRLMAAHERGYHIAAIHAEPMSRRVVTRYAFNEYARILVYAWMPEIDMDVIRTIVQDQ